ncbi:MAG: hypothetical protein DRN27_05275, partial [Thermoplasmata archaeon]
IRINKKTREKITLYLSCVSNTHMIFYKICKICGEKYTSSPISSANIKINCENCGSKQFATCRIPFLKEE